MPSDFLEELAKDGQMKQLEALNHCLRAFDLDRLLGTLYEFIETHVKHSPSNEKEWPYVECLLLLKYISRVDTPLNFASIHLHLAGLHTNDIKIMGTMQRKSLLTLFSCYVGHQA